jgi:transglutaminase-like putative cysteine protease
MAGREGPAQGRQRLLTAAAVAFTSVATALAFGRVFSQTGAAARLVVAALVCVGLAELTRRLNVFVAILISATGLFLLIVETQFAWTTAHGLPTSDTFSTLWRAISIVGEQARTQPSPAFPFPPLLLAGTAAVWAAAFACHALCVRAGSPLIALVPSVVLIAFADAVTPDGARPAYAFFFLCGVVAMVFADSLRRVGKWGTVERWSARGRTVAEGSARRIGAVVVVAAILAPGLLPWYRSEPSWKPHGASTGGGPIVLASFDTNLPSTTAAPLYQVNGPFPTYLRTQVLDRFDGKAWWPSVGGLVSTNESFQPPSWAASTLAGDVVTFRVTVKNAASPWIPLALQPLAISPVPQGTEFSGEDSTAAAPSDLPPGTTYTITARAAIPTPAQLDAAPDARTVYANTSEYNTYTQIPSGIPQSVYDLTRQVVRGQPDEYQRMLAIQSFLRTFTYSTQSTSPQGTNPVAYFLEVSKAGFCQQFAGAMALMARILGYPSRIAVGYLPGSRSGSDTYTITQQNAHTWPEILFPGYGWVAFEPTPGRNNPVADSYLFPGPSGGGGTPTGGAETATGGSTHPNPHSGKRGVFANTATGAPVKPVHKPSVVGWLAALALAFLIIFPIARGGLRRIPRGRGSRRAVIAAYHRFEVKAADVGWGRAPGETPNEHRVRLSDSVGTDAGRGLVGVLTKAAWSREEPDPADVEAARRDSAAAAKAVARSVPFQTRVRGWYRPEI